MKGNSIFWVDYYKLVLCTGKTEINYTIMWQIVLLAELFDIVQVLC